MKEGNVHVHVHVHVHAQAFQAFRCEACMMTLWFRLALSSAVQSFPCIEWYVREEVLGGGGVREG